MREGRALREACRLLMSRRFKGTTKCRSKSKESLQRHIEQLYLESCTLQWDYEAVVFLCCVGGVEVNAV